MNDKKSFNETITAFTSGDFPEAVRISKKERTPMSDKRLEMILDRALLALGMILIFLFFFTLFYLCR